MKLAGMLLFAVCTMSAGAADVGAFDGRWDVTLSCPRSSDGALPFAWEFMADVKDSALHGEHGTKGQPQWLALDGKIGPEGVADLMAHGVTGASAYTVNHTGEGVPYQHAVAAKFEGASGTGSWVTTRTCGFTFVKVKH
jgi:hypothetical protein